MKRWAGVLFMIAGLVVGGLAGALSVAGHYNRLLDQQYLRAVAEQTVLATRLRAVGSEPLVAEIEAALPSYVLALDRRFDREQTLPYLWAIQEYYETSGQQLPDVILDVLEDLPPRPPGCCLNALPPTSTDH